MTQDERRKQSRKEGLLGSLFVLALVALVGGKLSIAFAAECNKQLTVEGTGANAKEAVGDMLLKAEQACPSDCKGVKLVSQIHVFRETPVRASADFICEKISSHKIPQNREQKKDYSPKKE